MCPYPFNSIQASVKLNNNKLQYWQQIKSLFGTSLIGYWPMWESSGTIAYDQSGNGRNATYSNTGISYGQTGSGDGRTSIKIATSGTPYVDAYSENLVGAFNGLEGSLIILAKMPNLEAWSDGSIHSFAFLSVDTNNKIILRKGSANNSLDYYYFAGGVSSGGNLTGIFPSTEWMQIALTWSKSADQVKRYYNAVQNGSTLTGIGNWTGQLGASTTLIGASDKIGNGAMGGWISHTILLNRIASAVELRSIFPFTLGPMVFDGDSRTAGKSYPNEAYTVSNRSDVTVFNVGVSGQTISNMIVGAKSNVDVWIRSGRKNILIVWGGVNDAAAGGTDATTIYGRLKDYCLARKLAGWQVVVCSEIDAQDLSRNNVGWHSIIWPALNALLSADHSFVDGYADLGANANLQDATNTTYFNADKVHLTAAGYSTVAGIVGPVIASL